MTTEKNASTTITSNLNGFNLTGLVNNSKQDVITIEQTVVRENIGENEDHVEVLSMLSTKLALNQFISIPSEFTKELAPTFAVNSAGNTEQKSTGNENHGRDEISVITLSALLGSIYGLAFIFAIIWMAWLYVRRRKQETSFKSASLMPSRRREDSLSVYSNH